ncbi:DUF4402 domain-containing protein [bacterium]|nr:DUF4402 domain-containing protein [bacterium]
MKSFCRFSIMAVAFLALTGSAFAVDLSTNALVTIVEGLSVTESTALNFGELALNSGTVIVAAEDGSTTDASSLITDAASVSQGVFAVVGLTGWDIQVDCTAGAMPAGLTLSAFTADWADAAAEGAVPQTRTMAADSENVEIGASLAVDRTTATTGAAQLPYTVSVTFQ